MKVSVVTIVKDDPEGLRRTVESVRAQGCDEAIQYVVKDGASREATQRVLESLRSSIDVLASSPDTGIADAFNQSVRLTNGDTVLFMNAGDTFAAPDTLRRALDFLSDVPDVRRVVVYGDFISVDPETDERSRYLTTTTDLDKTNSINHQSAFTGRLIFDDILFDERLVLGMDYDFWLRCRRKYAFVKLPMEVACFYRGGRSSSAKWAVHNEAINFFLRAINDGRRLTMRECMPLFTVLAKRSVSGQLRTMLGDRTYMSIRRRVGLPVT